MKKSILIVLTILAVAALTAGLLVGCGNDKLANPRNMQMADGYVFSWNAVSGADGYLIYFNDDLTNRYFVANPTISVEDQDVRSALKSGTVNTMYIRAVNLDKRTHTPVNESDRSLIKFDYSRKLATPTRVRASTERLSWRTVDEAKNYKALVRLTATGEGTLYDLDWAAGTTGINGTIKGLASGTYYVSIVAVTEGYESSEPSEAVEYVHVGEGTAPSGGNEGKWAVTLDLNYEGAPQPAVVYVDDGSVMSTPTTPTRDGFKFEGWYEDSYCLVKAEFGSRISLFTITAPTTFYAKWTVDTTPPDPDHTHTLTRVDRVEATATSDGHKEYWSCSECGKCYEDEAATREIVDLAAWLEGAGKLPASTPECDYHVDADGDGKCDRCGKDVDENPVGPDTWNGTLTVDLSSITWFDEFGCVPYIHIWYVGGDINATYPGEAMTTSGTRRYTYLTDPAKTIEGIIIVRVNAAGTEMYNKTGDIVSIPEDHVITLSEADFSEIPEEERAIGGVTPDPGTTKPVYYFNADGWSSVNAYAWTASGGKSLGDWPGKAMSAVSGHDGWFSIEVPTSAQSIIFNNGDGLKTDDLTIDFDNPYYANGTWNATFVEGTTPEPDTTKTLYYRNVAGWSSVNAYAWTASGGKSLGDWPGQAMSAVSGHDGWYSIEVSSKAQKVIFNNGDGLQTADLTIDFDNPYYANGEWNATFVEDVVDDWDGTLTVDVSAISYFEEAGGVAYLYAWYVGGSENAGWPGVKMSKNGDGTWSGTIDTTKTLQGLIVVRCSPEGEKWNQSDDISTIPANHVIVITSMN